MTRLHRTITVAQPLEQVFDLIADFSTTERWDPAVTRATRVGEAMPGPAAEYDVVARFRGREVPIHYRTTVFERPNRVVLEGEGRTVRALDVIAFRARGPASTQIDYVLDLHLRGPSRLAQPFLKGAFDRLADRAMAGLADHLS